MKLIYFILLFLFPVALFAQQPVWQSVFVSESDEGTVLCNEMVRSASGDFYITGYFTKRLTLADSTVWSVGGQDAFVAKLNPNFKLIWLKIIGGPGDDAGLSIAQSNSGSVVVGGRYHDSLLIDGNKLYSKGDDDIFITSIMETGKLNWAKTAGGVGGDFIGIGKLGTANSCISFDSKDNIYISGTIGYNSQSPPLQLSAYFDSVIVTTERGADAFLAKYTKDGQLLWVHSAGGKYTDAGTAIFVQGDKICFTGYFSDPWIQFESKRLFAKEGPFQDMFIAYYDTAGAFLWARGAGNSNPVSGGSGKMDKDLNAYVTGTYFDQALDFGSYVLPNIGDFDMYVAKYDSLGNFIWARNGGGGGTDGAGGLALDPIGNLYATGTYGYDGIFGKDTVSGYRSDVFVAMLNASGIYQWVLTVEGTGDESVNDQFVVEENKMYVVGSFDSPTLTFGDITVQNAGDRNFFIARLGPDTTSTGIAKQKVSDQVEVYPNPVKEGAEVTVTFTPRRFQAMVVHDLQGREIMQTKISPSTSNTTINVSNWGQGIYFIRLYGEEGEVTTPFIIN